MTIITCCIPVISPVNTSSINFISFRNERIYFLTASFTEDLFVTSSINLKILIMFSLRNLYN
jgi:hypothetical protein